MSILDAGGMPIGQMGRSQARDSKGIDFTDLERLYNVVMQRSKTMQGQPAIERRVYIPAAKVDSAIAFWKPIYFNAQIEGRLLNGIEAYELGDPAKTPGVKCDKGPFIAMCNLMALEAIRMMGDGMPTAEKSAMLAFASDTEKAIAAAWKQLFAPTEFQAEWAWRAALSVLAGKPEAISEILDNYREQLP